MGLDILSQFSFCDASNTIHVFNNIDSELSIGMFLTLDNFENCSGNLESS